jgi:2,3-bisphosphoglycerate-dependent phosphoglycerate mutase
LQLLLVRHAEPVRIEDASAAADPPLHERGRQQAERLAAYLATEPLNAVWTSPLRRAQETAAPVAGAHGVDLVLDDELAEFDRESTSYIPIEELKATNDERWLAMVEGRHLDLAEGIDPVAFRDGVIAAMERVVAANPGGTVAVVCHGGVINTYIGHVLGIERALWFEPRYASIHRIAASRTGIRTVVTLNEHHYLKGLPGF